MVFDALFDSFFYFDTILSFERLQVQVQVQVQVQGQVQCVARAPQVCTWIMTPPLLFLKNMQ